MYRRGGYGITNERKTPPDAATGAALEVNACRSQLLLLSLVAAKVKPRSGSSDSERSFTRVRAESSKQSFLCQHFSERASSQSLTHVGRVSRACAKPKAGFRAAGRASNSPSLPAREPPSDTHLYTLAHAHI
eukprot:scaffold62912_cov65-Phaeocystis_antarctica.AAC.2